MKKNSGSILIELMIVIILEIVLISSIFAIYLNAQRSDQLQMTLNTIQKNARNIINIFRSEIHNAGYVGCQKSFYLSNKNVLTGNDHLLIIRKMTYPHASLKKMLDQQHFIVSDGIKFAVNDILLIADCKHIELFQIAAISHVHNGQKIKSVQPLKTWFDKYSDVGKLENNTFYIAETKRKDNNGKIISSLFFENLQHHKFELVEGIQAMHIRYLFLHRKKLLELEFDKILDWSKVVGVTLELSMTQSSIIKKWYSTISIGNF